MLDYPLLAAVAAVVREGSFERAARALHLTPSAVSQRVKLLEERVGQVLIVRGPPASATAAGLQLCRHMEQVGMLEHELLQALPALAADHSGRITLRVAVNADSLATWFVNAAATFAQTEPVLLDISLEDQDHTAERLRNADVIAAVTGLATPVQGCRSVPLGAMRYLATASPAYLQRHFAQGVTADTLAQAPCLTFNRQDRLQQAWCSQLLGHSVELPRHWLPSSQAFVDGCRAGLGWGMNPAPLVAQALLEGSLVCLQPDTPLMVPLYWQHTRHALPMLKRLTDAVVVAARQGLEQASPS